MSAQRQESAISADGRTFAWRVLGDGPPLLLVNGYAATSLDWDPSFLGALAARFTVLCPDNRGVGASELGDANECRVDAMAADLELLLDAADIDRAPVAGWSMGGFVAQFLAESHPERVQSLVLLSTDPGSDAAIRADPEVWERLIDHRGSPREQAARLISLLFPAPLAEQIDTQFGDIVADARAALSPDALYAQERAMSEWHATDRPPPPRRIPTLIAHGGEDVVIPPANAALLQARWPESRVQRFTGGGHAFMAQEPAALAGLISSFP